MLRDMIKFSTLAACAAMVCAHGVGAETPDPLNKARDLYYGAKMRGLTAFQCNAVPNWNVILAELIASNAAQAKSAIAKLSQLRFTVKAGPAVQTEVTHNELPADNEQQANGLKQVYAGMEKEISGFFATYGAFMFTRPLPEPGVAYDLKPDADKWNLTFKDGDADVSARLDKDFVIESMRIKSSAFDATINPVLRKNGAVLLLAGYEAKFDNGKAAEKTDLNVEVEHQNVGNFEVPQKLHVKGGYGASKFDSEVAFTNCQIVK